MGAPAPSAGAGQLPPPSIRRPPGSALADSLRLTPRARPVSRCPCPGALGGASAPASGVRCVSASEVDAGHAANAARPCGGSRPRSPWASGFVGGPYRPPRLARLGGGAAARPRLAQTLCGMRPGRGCAPPFLRHSAPLVAPGPLPLRCVAPGAGRWAPRAPARVAWWPSPSPLNPPRPLAPAGGQGGRKARQGPSPLWRPDQDSSGTSRASRARPPAAAVRHP